MRIRVGVRVGVRCFVVRVGVMRLLLGSGLRLAPCHARLAASLSKRAPLLPPDQPHAAHCGPPVSSRVRVRARARVRVRVRVRIRVRGRVRVRVRGSVRVRVGMMQCAVGLIYLFRDLLVCLHVSLGSGSGSGSGL